MLVNLMLIVMTGVVMVRCSNCSLVETAMVINLLI